MQEKVHQELLDKDIPCWTLEFPKSLESDYHSSMKYHQRMKYQYVPSLFLC